MLVVQTPKSSKKAIRALFIFSLATNILILAVPMHMLQVYDRVLTSKSVETLIYLTVLVVMALAAYAVAEAIRGLLAQRLSSQFMLEHAENVFDFLAHDKSNAHEPGKVLRDLNSVRAYLASRQFINLFDLPYFPIFLILMFFLHVTLGLVAIIGIAAMVIVAVLNYKVTETARSSSHQANNEAITFSQTVMHRTEEIRAMGLLPAIMTRWGNKTAASLINADNATSYSSAFFGAGRLVRQALQVLTMAWGAFLVLQGDMSGGMIFAATMLLGKTLMPIEQLIGGWDAALNNYTAYKSLINISRASENKPTLTELPSPMGNLSVENLVYQPDVNSSGKPILNLISFEIEPGEILGVVGPSGGGKSTLARLIVGAIAPTSGVIRLDNFDIEQWPEAQRGKSIGYVPQDIVLFPGTIAENIARLELEPSDKQIVEAAKLAGVHEMIADLPDGYSTIIGSGALPISGGQRQRIALARAFFSSPQILVLDEPNSHLDQKSEDLLLTSLVAAKQNGVAILVVSQRRSILKIADRLMVIESGEITSFGPNKGTAQTKTGPVVTVSRPSTSSSANVSPGEIQPLMPDNLVKNLRSIRVKRVIPDSNAEINP